MKYLVLSLLLAALFATPAFAKTHKHHHHSGKKHAVVHQVAGF